MNIDCQWTEKLPIIDPIHMLCKYYISIRYTMWYFILFYNNYIRQVVDIIWSVSFDINSKVNSTIDLKANED